ncbi:MAG: hypothetical protein CMJ28_04445 [Phycisphaerae bacterium]|nr:hypothetical protein [Phycisphaerae bacterium]
MSEDSQECDLELSRTARLIRRHCEGSLRFDEHFQNVRYCRATDGRLIIPAMAAMQMAEELVLHVPDATDQSIQLMVTGESFTDHDAMGGEADRWRIHFGEPEDLQWLALELDLGKRDGLVFDGEALQEPHAFSDQEPKLLRALQDEQTLITHRVAKILGHDPEEARPVAADQHGLTVRVRLGTVRLEFDAPQHDPEPSAYLNAVRNLPETTHDDLSI